MEMSVRRAIDSRQVPEAVARLGNELRAHHQATAEHSNRLAALSRRVADRLGLDALDATEVELVAVLHDVGKLAVPSSVLDHGGPLTSTQRRVVRRHTVEGGVLLAQTAGLEHLADAVRATHERWDGAGYPDGLAGEAIPRAARIVGCVDAYDAMTHARAYRLALSQREAFERLRDDAGRQFDPRVVAAMLDLFGVGG